MKEQRKGGGGRLRNLEGLDPPSVWGWLMPVGTWMFHLEILAGMPLLTNIQCESKKY